MADGWYPDTLQMQKEAVKAAEQSFFSGAGTAPILQIIAESDPFSPYETAQTPHVAEIVIEWLNWLRNRGDSSHAA